MPGTVESRNASAGKDLESGAPVGVGNRGLTPGGPSPERVIELVNSRRAESIRYNHGVFTRLQSWYNTYRGYWQGRLSQFRNAVTIPFTFAMIQSDVARKVQASLAGWPIVGFEGYAPEDAASAKRNEILISAQMKDADSVVRAIDFLLQADISGTAILRYGWKTLRRWNRMVKKERIAPGLAIPVLHEYNAEIFNGPIWEPVDRLDFLQQPARKRIDDMAWVIHQYWADLDDLLEDSRDESPYFDPEAVKRLQDYPMGGEAQTQWITRRVTFRNEYDYMARQRERFAKPVHIWEMHGYVPAEFAPDGMRHRCIAIGNGRVVLKNREGPMPNQQKPFIAYSPMPDPYSFDGVGKCEIAFGPQMTVNRITNQKLDGLDLLIDNQWIVNSSANINTQHLFSRAGRVITVDASTGIDNAIKPLAPDMRGLQAAYTEVGQLFGFMQLGLGITDAILGVGNPDRETARGFLGRQENVLTRLSMETRLFEEQVVEPLANSFRMLDRLLLDTPHTLKILGSVASVDPISGLPYGPEQITVDEDDLASDYRARAVGSSQMIGRSARQQNIMALVQIMSSNPAMLQLVNWANFAKQIFEDFDMKNVSDLLVQQVPMVNQIAAQTGQSPQNVANAAQQPLDQLSTGILGQGMQQAQSPISMAGMNAGALGA